MNVLRKLDKFHKTRFGYLVFGLVELALVYLLGSLAIDRGNLLYYLLAFILLVGFLQNIIKFIGTFAHGSKREAS